MAHQVYTVRLNLAGVGPYTAGWQQVNATTMSTANAMQAAATRASAAATGIARFAGIAGKALIVGLGAGLAISAKAAIDFETSFAGIRKTVDTTDTGFKILERDMRDLAKQIPISIHELNRIGELGGQLGIDPDNLTEFTEVIAELGATTNVTTEEASIQFARLANILGVGEDKFRNMGSTLVDLGNNFATTESEILNFALRIAPIGSVVGMTSDQVMALATALTSVGVPAERGGTAVQKVFTRMAKAVAEGGSELRAFGETAGMTADEFAEAFEEDAAGAFNKFVMGLGAINDAGGNVFEMLGKVNLNNERTVQSLLALAEGGYILTDALDTASAAFETNTALSIEAGKRFDTTASKMAMARNHINDLRIEIGQHLLPVIGDVAKDIGLLADRFQTWSAIGKRSAANVVLAIGGVLIVLKRAIVAYQAAAAGARAAAFGMSMLRTALVGVGLAVFTTLLIKAAEATARLEERTQDFVQALRDEREGIEDAAKAALKTDLLDVLTPADFQALHDAGISLASLIDTIYEGGDAYGYLKRRLDSLNETAAKGEMYTHGADPLGIDEQRGKALALTSALMALLDTQGIFHAAQQRAAGEIADELLYAQEQELENWLKQDEALGRAILRYGSAEAAMKQLTDGSIQLGDGTRYSAEQFSILEDQIRSLEDAELASRDSLFSVMDAIGGYTDAQAALAAEGGNTIRNQMALMQAFNRVQAAMLNLGDDGIEPLKRNLEEMRMAGLINEEQYRDLFNLILQFAPVVASATGKGTTIMLGNLGVASDAMEEFGLDVVDVIKVLFGLSDVMQMTLANASLFQQGYSAAMGVLAGGPALGYQIAQGTLSQQAAGVAWQIQQLIAGNLAAAGSAWAGLGNLFANEIAGGISGGGGAVSEAVEEVLQAAIDKAKEKMSILTGEISAGMSKFSALRRLSSAEKELADLRKENLALPGQIAAKERELTQARKDARKVTLEERKAIEETQEEYRRAQAAFRQGLISETDLALAEQAWQAAKTAARAPGEEVNAIEKELNDLKERRVEINEEIEEAEWSLIEAQMAAIEAQLALIEAGRQWVEGGEAGLAMFRKIARQAGLSNLAIEGLIESFIRLGAEAYSEAPGLLGPLGGGGTPDVTADTLILADTGPATSKILLEGQKTINSGTLTPFTPNGANGSISATRGGFNPEVFKVVNNVPGGMVINNNAPGIERLVVHVQGVMDPSDPQSVSRVVDVIEGELVRRGIGGH